jgi:hypothetical protein
VVDWPTVALSGIGSTVGVLTTVLLERRREDARHLAANDRRIEALDGRVRAMEQEVVALRPANQFFTELATGELKGRVRRLGGR